MYAEPLPLSIATKPKKSPSVDHTLLEMVRMRVYGILAGYPDQNDHAVLRSDPAFKLVAGRSVDDDDLASQPTLSRFENAIDVKSLRRLPDVFIDHFIASYEKPPTQITLDSDPSTAIRSMTPRTAISS